MSVIIPRSSTRESSPAGSARPVQIVFLASPGEEAELKALHQHISPLYRRGGVRAMLPPAVGEQVDDWWRHCCHEADIFVALLSAEFIYDERCWPRFLDALRAAERGNAKLVPIRVRPFVPADEIARINVLPRGEASICDRPGRDAAWVEIVTELDGLAKEILSSRRKARARVFSVGIDRHRHSSFKLAYAVKDARDFSAAWRSQSRTPYQEVWAPDPLTDEQATRDSILAGLDGLSIGVGDDDVTVVYLAGSGRRTSAGYVYIPHDMDLARDQGAIRGAEIWDAVKKIPGWRILFLDTCNAGRLVEDLTDRAGPMAFFAATNVEENALELKGEQNGAFTCALLEGLRGAAEAGRSGTVTLTSLFTYASGRVRELTQGRQSPTMAIFNATTDIVLSYVASSR